MSSNSPEVVCHNPILLADAPDPMVVRSGGEYHLLSTQADTKLGSLNVPHWTSRNLRDWWLLGDALPQQPEFAKTTHLTMAPHVVKVAGEVRAFLSTGVNSSFGDGHGIVVASAADWSQPLQPEQVPLVGGTEPGFRHIDPMVFVDPETGIPYLIWGSAGFPLMMQALSSDMKRFAQHSRRHEVFQPRREFGRGVIEAAWVLYDRYAPRDRRYQLYFSFGDCFGAVNEYQVGVAIATQVTGPYHFQNVAWENTAQMTNAGHHSFVVDETGRVIEDPQGQILAVTHAVPTEIVREEGQGYKQRPVAVVPLQRERLAYGRQGVFQGKLQAEVLLGREWVPEARAASAYQIREQVKRIWQGVEVRPVDSAIPASIATVVLGLLGEGRLQPFGKLVGEVTVPTEPDLVDDEARVTAMASLAAAGL